MKHFYTSLLVVFSLTMSLALTAHAQDTKAWIPFKKDPSFSVSGVLFMPMYKGPGKGDDSVPLKTSIPITSSVTYGYIGRDLKILVNGKHGAQTVNILIIYLYDLNNETLAFDSATITYEYRSNSEPRLDHGFKIGAPAGALLRTEASLILQLDAVVLRRSSLKYWSIAMPGYTTGQANSAEIAADAFVRFEVLSRGKIIDSNWLRPYTEGRSVSIRGIEFDMFNRYYYQTTTDTSKYQLSRSSEFDSVTYAADWSRFSGRWEDVSPYFYPVNVFEFSLSGFDTSTLHAEELFVGHSYQDGGQSHYDWWYSLSVKDVIVKKTKTEFLISIDAAMLRNALISFSDHIAPVHRWGSSVAFRVNDGGGCVIRARRPVSSVKELDLHQPVVYPNPCTDHLMIQSEHDKWWVVNALGERIDLASPVGARLDVRGLVGGVYLLMNGQDMPRRFVKAH